MGQWRTLAVLGLILSPVARGGEGGLVPGSPKLARGEEYHYVGEVVEAGERADNRFRKFHALEVRLLVLDVYPGHADCALLTRLAPKADPTISRPIAAMTGADPAQAGAALARLDLVRVDFRGRVTLLLPPGGPPPLPLGPETPCAQAPGVALEGPPAVEVGMFVPAPGDKAAAWASAEPERPPVQWAAAGEVLWNGGRCYDVRGAQQTDAYEQPAKAVRGWRRTEQAAVMPGENIACKVARRVERREGRHVVGWVEVKYELQPTQKHAGARYADTRREAELAYAYGAELAALHARRADRAEFQARLAKLDRGRAESATSFREAVDATRARYARAAAGEAPPPGFLALAQAPPPAPVEAPRVGQLAPDFVAPFARPPGQFRLRAPEASGPTVLVFYRPGATTSPGALKVADALQAKFAGKARVAALSLAPDAAAGPEGGARRLDGAALRATYAVATYPRFFVVDAAGTLAWQFDGFGPEVGYLVREQVEAQLKPAPANVGAGKGAGP